MILRIVLGAMLVAAVLFLGTLKLSSLQRAETSAALQAFLEKHSCVFSGVLVTVGSKPVHMGISETTPEQTLTFNNCKSFGSPAVADQMSLSIKLRPSLNGVVHRPWGLNETYFSVGSVFYVGGEVLHGEVNVKLPDGFLRVNSSGRLGYPPPPVKRLDPRIYLDPKNGAPL
jgi:hypothetical protein